MGPGDPTPRRTSPRPRPLAARPATRTTGDNLETSFRPALCRHTVAFSTTNPFFEHEPVTVDGLDTFPAVVTLHGKRRVTPVLTGTRRSSVLSTTGWNGSFRYRRGTPTRDRARVSTSAVFRHVGSPSPSVSGSDGTSDPAASDLLPSPTSGVHSVGERQYINLSAIRLPSACPYHVKYRSGLSKPLLIYPRDVPCQDSRHF